MESFDIFDKINKVSFIAPNARTKLIKLVGGDRIIDILLHLPVAFINKKSLKDGKIGDTVFCNVQIVKHKLLKNQNISISCLADGGIPLDFIFFNSRSGYPFRLFPIGTKHYIKGRICKHLTIAHPEKIVAQNEYPVYSLTYGITQSFIFNLIKEIFKSVKDIVDWTNNEISFLSALQILHSTGNEEEKKKLCCV